MSIRWLVPIAAASSRRLRSLRPCARMWSTAAARSRSRGVCDRPAACGCLASPQPVYHLVHVPGGTEPDDRGGESMGEQTISARAWTAASPAEVYRLLRSGATWPVLVADRLVRAGAGGRRRRREPRRGAGSSAPAGRRATRRSSSSSPTAGSATRCSRACRCAATAPTSTSSRATAAPRSTGTAASTRSCPGTGRIFRRFLGGFIQRCVDGLAAYAAAAERSERSTPRVASRAWPPCDRRRRRTRTR